QGRTREPWRRPGDRQVRRGGASCAPFHSMFTLDLLLVLASSRVGLERRPRETIGEPLATRPDAASRVRRVRVCSYQPRSSTRRAGLPLSSPSPRRPRAWGGQLAAAGPFRPGSLPRHERAREGRRLLPVLVERRPEPRERAVTLGEAEAVNRHVVDELGVEDVLHVPAAAHAGRRLLRQSEKWSERGDVLGEHRLVPQVTRHFGEAGEKLVHGYLRANRLGLRVEIGHEADLQAGALPVQIYYGFLPIRAGCDPRAPPRA